jgi:hypothetical protein
VIETATAAPTAPRYTRDASNVSVQGDDIGDQ